MGRRGVRAAVCNKRDQYTGTLRQSLDVAPPRWARSTRRVFQGAIKLSQVQRCCCHARSGPPSYLSRSTRGLVGLKASSVLGTRDQQTQNAQATCCDVTRSQPMNLLVLPDRPPERASTRANKPVSLFSEVPDCAGMHLPVKAFPFIQSWDPNKSNTRLENCSAPRSPFTPLGVYCTSGYMTGYQ
jgi:hypothetical protein